MTKDVLQLIIAVLGIISQFLLIARHMKASAKESAAAESSPSQLAVQGGTMAGKLARTRNMLDLSFVFIGAAFFSFLIMDSLLISGRPPSAGIFTIVMVSFITLAVAGAMLAAWLFNQVELVMGYMALTTLAVVVLSPGGPFLSAEQAGEAGLWLMIPVISLVVISSSMLIYSHGSPLSNAISRRKRLLVSSLLVGVAIVGAGSLGQQFIKGVGADPRTPRIEEPQVKALLQTIMQARLQDQRAFYRLASEVYLAPTYQEYALTRRAQEAKYQPSDPAAVTAPPGSQAPAAGISHTGGTAPSRLSGAEAANSSQPEPARSAGNKNGPGGAAPASAQVKPPASSAPAPAPSPVVTPPVRSVSKLEAVAEVRKLIRADHDLDTEQVFSEWAAKSPSLSKVVIQEQGGKRANARTAGLVNYFDALDPDEKETYLAQRLEWIHPVGLPDQSEAKISLPGIKPEDRVFVASEYRIYQVLAERENLRNELFGEFDGYTQDIRKEFQADSRTGRLLMDPGKGSSKYKRDLFPKPGPNANDANLMEQLGLPSQIEGGVAYDQYKRCALQLTQHDFQFQNIPVDQRQSLIGRFNQLDDATQEAILVYVVNNKKYTFDEVYRMLIDLGRNHIDFQALTASQNPLAVKDLANLIEHPNLPSTDARLKELAETIRHCDSRTAQNLLTDLLKNEVAGIPLKPLLQGRVFDLIAEVERNIGQGQRALFEALVDPVWLVVKDLAKRSAESGLPSLQIADALDHFRSLKAPEQEGLLHYLAIALYQSGGESSLDPMSLLVVQAKFYSDSAALLCAAALMLPLVLGAILMGAFFSRKLVARDRIRSLVAREGAGHTEIEDLFPLPVELFGRGDILRRLRSLAERGWSTIGVVGRRGVGKSRLLYALSHSSSGGSEAPVIKVWVSSPSKFQEEDFISSMFERLALSTEAAIAKFLGVKPISTRRIETHTAIVSACLYASAFTVMAIIVVSRMAQLTRVDIVVTWLPILALIFTSIGVFINHLSKLQPVDLSSWLQRDRTHTPHLVMLYREVFDVLKYLRHRARNSPAEESASRGSLLRAIALTVLGALSVYAFLVFLFTAQRPSFQDSPSSPLIALTIGIASLIIWIIVYQYRGKGRERSAAYGQSLMSLIADYRTFAAMIVYRLKQGALGHAEERKFSVLVCVDELDKIVEFEDIRAFVRRIKAIFEVPGVYYYVSLAEDTLTKLYLGPAEGKNEIDSAFDHIVRIPPVACDMAEAIAADYLKAHSFSNCPARLARTIAVLSFGVPRDIIRRCDELIARPDAETTSATELARELRERHGLMGYDLQQLSSGERAELARDAYASAVFAQQLLDDGSKGQSTQRLVLSLWLIAEVERALELPDEEKWKTVSEKLCELGYKLPIDQICDLKEQIAKIHHADLMHQAS